MKKQTAFIDHWHVFANCLVGNISKHPRQTEFHSDTQMTSRLVSFEPEKKRAETVNTIYTLGERM